MTAAALHYLDFDESEDELGHGSFDAMAAAEPARLPALRAEVARVLEWAHAAFGAPGPLEDGAGWDYELQGVREVATTLEVRFHAGEPLALLDGPSGAPRVTLSLTLSGTATFCDAFREAFHSG